MIHIFTAFVSMRIYFYTATFIVFQ